MVGFILLMIHGYCQAFYGESFVKDVVALWGAIIGELLIEFLGFCLVWALNEIKHDRF